MATFQSLQSSSHHCYQPSLLTFLDYLMMVTFYICRFQDKTKNTWPVVHEFEKCPGKYDLVHVDYSTGVSNTSDESGYIFVISY